MQEVLLDGANGSVHARHSLHTSDIVCREGVSGGGRMGRKHSAQVARLKARTHVLALLERQDILDVGVEGGRAGDSAAVPAEGQGLHPPSHEIGHEVPTQASRQKDGIRKRVFVRSGNAMLV